MAPSTRWNRSSTAMSYASALSGWAGSRRPAVWARCWAPSSLYVGTPYVGVALVGQIALGVAWGVVNPLHNTIVQTTAPLGQLGRVNSVMGFGNMFAGVAPLAIAPWLASTFGVQQTLVGAGMVVTAVPAALLLFGRRHFDRSARQ